MTKVRFVEACYSSVMRWDVESIAEENNFKLEDIDYMYVGKWVRLFIHLKDGEVYIVDSGDHDWYNYTDWKYPLEEIHLDENRIIVNLEEEPDKDTQQNYLIQEVTNNNLN